MDRGVLWATIHRVAESDMTKVTDQVLTILVLLLILMCMRLFI